MSDAFKRWIASLDARAAHARPVQSNHVPLVHVHVGLLADEVGEPASNTLDRGHGVHHLLLSIDVCVQHTQNVLEVFALHDRLRSERGIRRQLRISNPFPRLLSSSRSRRLFLPSPIASPSAGSRTILKRVVSSFQSAIRSGRSSLESARAQAVRRSDGTASVWRRSGGPFPGGSRRIEPEPTCLEEPDRPPLLFGTDPPFVPIPFPRGIGRGRGGDGSDPSPLPAPVARSPLLFFFSSGEGGVRFGPTGEAGRDEGVDRDLFLGSRSAIESTGEIERQGGRAAGEIPT